MFTDRLVETFAGGFAFKLRYDEKIIPASVTTEMANARIAEVEEREGRRLPGKERARIRDEVFFELLPRALVQTKRITCFYRPENNLLIVPTTSKKLADIVTSRLIKAVGSIKATTIYISDIKCGLTAKLRDYIEDNQESFADFTVGGKVKLKNEETKKTAQFKLDEITEARDGIIESIKSGANVVELELCTDDSWFRIDEKFTLKGVELMSDSEEVNFDSELDHFQHEASVQVLFVADVVNKLCKLFEYKEPAQDDAQEAA
jgi:recombination associated protein RdgC